MAKYKPFLKWAGNKYRILNYLLTSFSNAPRLIEPFTGSAAVFLNVDYPAYLLAEANRDLVALFHCLQREGKEYIDYCEQFFTANTNQKAYYYLMREQFNKSNDARERAAMFLYLNRHGYNGLCRYNSSGLFNVPFGRYIKPYFPRAEMQFFSQKSQSAIFMHSDFRDTFTHACPGDIIYCDPPYAPLIQRSNFSAYTRNKFGEKEQIILAELARTSAKRGITVIISNHDTEFTRLQYQGADIKSFTVPRFISCQARIAAKELIAVFRP